MNYNGQYKTIVYEEEGINHEELQGQKYDFLIDDCEDKFNNDINDIRLSTAYIPKK